MQVRDFQELIDRAEADPERAARIARERVAAIGEIVEYRLAEVRRAREITQNELAAALGTGQSNVSRMEHATEMELATLRRYVEALGGRVEVTAVFDDDRLRVAVGDGRS